MIRSYIFKAQDYYYFHETFPKRNNDQDSINKMVFRQLNIKSPLYQSFDRRFLYSYLSNKRSPTIDNNRHRFYTALIFGRPGTQGYHSVKRITIYVARFWKKSLKNWVKIKKRGYFQKLLYIALQKFQAPSVSSRPLVY